MLVVEIANMYCHSVGQLQADDTFLMVLLYSYCMKLLFLFTARNYLICADLLMQINALCFRYKNSKSYGH